ncbi:uncharacterized protein LOC130140084 [Syzygium oleosum]|uniref:uncharacterized protein LOC130140084 n=1 Tax=Syzygium oleosum TaxID=219896 RepID=UPI0024B8BE24|nr:uncharacterized protein LOC130140084 [Syzygium oleosum]
MAEATAMKRNHDRWLPGKKKTTTAASFRLHQWRLPEPEELKINIDGAYLPRTNEGAVVSVCRDNSGKLIDGFARSIEASSAAQAEAQAMVETLMYFSTRTKVSLKVESDHFDLISALTGGAQIGWEIQGLIKKAHSLLKSFKDLKLTYINRESNRVAD